MLIARKIECTAMLRTLVCAQTKNNDDGDVVVDNNNNNNYNKTIVMNKNKSPSSLLLPKTIFSLGLFRVVSASFCVAQHSLIVFSNLFFAFHAFVYILKRNFLKWEKKKKKKQEKTRQIYNNQRYTNENTSRNDLKSTFEMLFCNIILFNYRRFLPFHIDVAAARVLVAFCQVFFSLLFCSSILHSERVSFARRSAVYCTGALKIVIW